MEIKRILLWDKGEFVPRDDTTPYMDVYLLPKVEYDNPDYIHKKRPMVVICPGGGYEFLSEREAEPIALKYLAKGYDAAVVYYSLKPYPYPQALLDVGQAMVTVRRHAEEWDIDENHIAICGFSAGGHLAGCLSTMWKQPWLADKLQVQSEMLRPNMALLCYPVITSGEYAHKGSFDVLVSEDESLREKLSLENLVNSDTPPTYLWHTATDTTVPVVNSLMYAQKLSEYHIPFELHVFPRCEHGMATAEAEISLGNAGGEDSYIASWVEDTYRFLTYAISL